MPEQDYAADYLALKAANDQLRERGKQWLWDLLDRLCDELNQQLLAQGASQPELAGAPSILSGVQADWQFKVENAVMVGERYGARFRYRTLTVEVGWPRLPEHGYITDGGLARGRIGLSQNTMIEPQPIAELILKKVGGEPAWFVFKNKQLSEQITEAQLREHLNQIMAD
ncbi:MAG TPA: hypothetical protein PLD20_03195 [Blastocatellia bacterium]|nr:hypothetical protein [Blastocatellia bacterium]HMV82061.1 hypothetical protein [Blastocatellia bacterium]HMX27409.1 hypothetical protein [Blastocatellia bacterium]HMY70400.1 hypothetical protein [Blastocatellia bacterium]HMZ16910.1 hypothetical protein [Blastocatellia bacterium]